MLCSVVYVVNHGLHGFQTPVCFKFYSTNQFAI